MRDSEGIISSIIYGPDQRTQITAQTRNVIFTTYAPSEVSEEAVTNDLHEIQRNVELIAPNSTVELLRVFSANA